MSYLTNDIFIKLRVPELMILTALRDKTNICHVKELARHTNVLMDSTSSRARMYRNCNPTMYFYSCISRLIKLNYIVRISPGWYAITEHMKNNKWHQTTIRY